MRLDSHLIAFATHFDKIARLNCAVLHFSSNAGLGSHKHDRPIASRQSPYPNTNLYVNENMNAPLMTQVEVSRLKKAFSSPYNVKLHLPKHCPTELAFFSM